MDWLEERAEKLFAYIRNLSFRKAMLAYILVLAAVVWGMSFLTMSFCLQWEAGLWAKLGETQIVNAVFYERELLQGYRAGVLYSADEALILFLNFFRVWCPFLYAFPGIILAIFLFYGKRLARPLSILEGSVEKIRKNDLDFVCPMTAATNWGNSAIPWKRCVWSCFATRKRCGGSWSGRRN